MARSGIVKSSVYILSLVCVCGLCLYLSKLILMEL